MNNDVAEQDAVAAVVRKHLTAETLRESVLTTDGDADWSWAAAHWADYLAQQIAEALKTPTEV